MNQSRQVLFFVLVFWPAFLISCSSSSLLSSPYIASIPYVTLWKGSPFPSSSVATSSISPSTFLCRPSQTADSGPHPPVDRFTLTSIPTANKGQGDVIDKTHAPRVRKTPLPSSPPPLFPSFLFSRIWAVVDRGREAALSHPFQHPPLVPLHQISPPDQNRNCPHHCRVAIPLARPFFLDTTGLGGAS